MIGVGVYHGAYISEVIRTGIEAIPRGQSEAAASQGFSYLETMYYIILPQTIRIIMPPLANQALNLVKNTSILAMVAGMDLMYFTDSWGSERNFFAQAYFTSALLYFIICFPLARLARYLEIRSMRMPAPKKYCLRRKAHADIILPDFYTCQYRFYVKGTGNDHCHCCISHTDQYVFGTILALIRTYASGRFKWAASLVAVYTEFFRCTPNLLWILWIYFTVKGNKIAVSVFAISLFTSAVMAEIVRGGLNSISKGQFEAAQSQGFSFIQTLWYIILPQTYRKIIPALLSQVITVIKDTSS